MSYWKVLSAGRGEDALRRHWGVLDYIEENYGPSEEIHGSEEDTSNMPGGSKQSYRFPSGMVVGIHMDRQGFSGIVVKKGTASEEEITNLVKDVRKSMGYSRYKSKAKDYGWD